MKNKQVKLHQIEKFLYRKKKNSTRRQHKEDIQMPNKHLGKKKKKQNH